MKKILILSAFLWIGIWMLPLVVSAQSKDEAVKLYKEGLALHEKARSDEDLKKASQKYEQALAIFLKIGDSKYAGYLYNSIGNNYLTLNEPEKALEYFEKSLETVRKLGDRKAEASPLNNLGTIYQTWGDNQKAAEYFEKSLEIARKLEDLKGQVKPLSNLGLIYQTWGEHQKALEYFEKSLEIARKVPDLEGESFTLNNLGHVYQDWGQYDKAVEQYEKALEIRRKLKNATGEASCLVGIGSVYQAWGHYDKAVEQYEKALEIYRQLKNASGEANCFRHLGSVYQAWSQYDKAVVQYEKALEIRRQHKNPSGEASCLLGIGSVYQAWGHYDKAVEQYEKALEIYLRLKNTSGEASCLGNLGNVYQAWGQLDKAVAQYEKALAIRRQLNSASGEAHSLGNLGSVYQAWSQFDKAVEQYEKALEIYLRLKNASGEAQCLANVGSVYQSWGQYDRAVELYEKALGIRRRLKNASGEAHCLNHLGSVYQAWGQFDKALEHYDKALTINKELKNASGEATGLRHLGGVYQAWGKYEEAAQQYEKALAIRKQLKNPSGEAQCLGALGSVYQAWGQYDKAVEQYEKALAISRQLKNAGSEAAGLRHLGSVYQAWGEYEKAVEQYEKSLAISRQLKNPGGEAHCLINIGNVLLAWGKNDKAMEFYEKTLTIYRQLKNPGGEASCLNNLGLVHKNWGSYDKAVKLYEQALAIDRELRLPRSEALVLGNLADVYTNWGQYEKAIEFHEKSLAIRRQIKDPAGEARSLNGLGSIYSNWGQYDKATQSFEKVLSIRRELRDPSGEASTLTSMGIVYWRKGEFPEALVRIQKGYEIFQGIKVPTRWSRSQLVGLHIDMGRIDLAEPLVKELSKEYEDQPNKTGLWAAEGRFFLVNRDYRNAVDCYSKLLKDAEDTRTANSMFTAYCGLGTAYEALGDYAQAEAYFRKGVEFTEELRSSLSSEQRETFFDVKVNGFFRTAPYEGLARVLMKLGRASEAWNTSEYTKARLFAEAMSRRSGIREFDLPRDILRVDEELSEQLAALKRSRETAYEAGNKKLIESLEPQIRELETKFQAHIKMLREKYPLFAATKYPQPMQLSQTSLKENEWVLSYDVTDTGLLIYLNKGPRLVQAWLRPVVRQDLDDLARKFREPLEISEGERILEQLQKFDFAAGKKLSDILLGDILPLLPKDAPVIVIPSGSLGVVPFEMLVLDEGGKIAADKRIPYTVGAEFFGDRNPVSYYQSVTALTLARTFGKQKVSGETFLIMDDPVFDPDDTRFKKLAREKRQADLSAAPDKLLSVIKQELNVAFPRLDRTRDLGEALKKMEPKKTEEYTGMEAAKKVLFEKPLDRFRSMVFATHGYFGKDLPGIMEPVLVLTLVNQPPGKDGYLRLSEVMGLKLGADIVALTACQTGLGRHISGEGTMGMGRAFQYAGAKSVLMSLWSVSEAGSVTLVESFFKHLRERKNKLEALKLAREEIRKAGYDHPFFWAPFVLVGEVQ